MGRARLEHQVRRIGEAERDCGDRRTFPFGKDWEEIVPAFEGDIGRRGRFAQAGKLAIEAGEFGGEARIRFGSASGGEQPGHLFHPGALASGREEGELERVRLGRLAIGAHALGACVGNRHEMRMRRGDSRISTHCAMSPRLQPARATSLTEDR